MHHHFIQFLQEFPTRISWFRVCYNSDNFLLDCKYFFAVGSIAPENYTIT